MSSQKNKEIIISFYKSFDNLQMDEAMELLSPDFVGHLAGVTQPSDKLNLQLRGDQCQFH